MASSLFQQMNQSQPNSLAQMYKSMSNPNAMLNILMNNNPQMKSVMDMIKKSGKSPKDLFYEKANEMGVDPESILSQLR